MKKIYLSLLSLFLLVFLAPTLALASTDQPTSLQNKERVLFVLLSRHGSIHEVSGKQGQYQLTLKGVNPQVIYFADRPARFANHVSLDKFLERWSEGSFKKDPPNAVMEGVRFSGGQVKPNNTTSYAIVLSNPVYDSQKAELVFDIKPLSGKASLPILSHSDYLALFIDSSCLSCF